MNNRLEEYEGEEEISEKKSGKSAHKDSVSLLTMIQIIGCAVVLAAAICIKTSGGEVYKTVRNWYFSAFNDSIIADEQVKDVKDTVVELWSSISSVRGDSSSIPSSAKPQSGASSANTQQGGKSQNSVSGHMES